MAVYMNVRGRSDDVPKAQLGCEAPKEWRKSCANGGGGGPKVEILDYISLNAQLRISHVHNPRYYYCSPSQARVTASSAQQPDSLVRKGSPRRIADFGTRSLGWRANFSRRHPSRIPPGSSKSLCTLSLHQEPSVQRFITYTALAPFPFTPAQARVSPIMDRKCSDRESGPEDEKAG